MPRSTSRSNSSSANSSSSSKTTVTKNTTVAKISPTVSTTPVTMQTNKPSLMSTVKDGIASGVGWGIGTSIARSIFGGTGNTINQSVESKSVENTPAISKCLTETENYRRCNERFGSDFCQNELDFLNKCKKQVMK